MTEPKLTSDDVFAIVELSQQLYGLQEAMDWLSVQGMVHQLQRARYDAAKGGITDRLSQLGCEYQTLATPTGPQLWVFKNKLPLERFTPQIQQWQDFFVKILR